MSKSYIFTDEYLPISDVVRIDDKTLQLAGENVKGSGLRIKVILDEMSCVSCGLEVTHAKLCPNTSPNARNAYHVNFFGRRSDGKWVMMTLDHIVPKSQGGPNAVDNGQAMCQICNGAKSDY